MKTLLGDDPGEEDRATMLLARRVGGGASAGLRRAVLRANEAGRVGVIADNGGGGGIEIGGGTVEVGERRRRGMPL